MSSNLTPAEKVDKIYNLLIEAEKRRILQIRWRTFKLVVLLLLVLLIVTQPELILWKITEVLKPIILSTASGMIENQKSELINSLKDALPSGIEMQ